MDADGTHVQRVMPTAGDRIDPAWSPDGKHIAFVDLTAFDGALVVVDADGRNERFPSGAEKVRAPAWSPDGTRIVYAHYDTDGSQLRIAPLTGRGDHPVTPMS